MKQKHKDKSKKQKNAALEQIEELFSKAKESFSKDPKLSDDFIRKARRIAMKNKVRLPLELKRRICKKCYCYLVPGKNLRVRTHEGHVVYHCMKCKGFTRIGYK